MKNFPYAVITPCKSGRFALKIISNKWSTWIYRISLKVCLTLFIGSVPLFAWIIAGVATLLMLYFSGRIYRWDVRLIYGRVFGKPEETIAEMEQLKRE